MLLQPLWVLYRLSPSFSLSVAFRVLWSTTDQPASNPAGYRMSASSRDIRTVSYWTVGYIPNFSFVWLLLSTTAPSKSARCRETIVAISISLSHQQSNVFHSARSCPFSGAAGAAAR
jgi:hypothetical protein